MTKIQITRWSPDTCKCIIDYQWDSDIPIEQRVHTYSKTIKDCPEHSSLGSTIFDVILEENQRKNKLYSELIKLDSIGEDVVQEDGSIIRQLKKGIRYDWQFDQNRKLEVMVLGTTLSQKDKDDLQTISDSKLGSGKIKVL